MNNILIIEDEPEIAALQRDYLEISGYCVTIAGSGDEGLKYIKDNDLVILDIMLPGMDGFEILRRIRETSNIPVIMLSARSEDIDKIRGLGLGADDYMQKPFSPGELIARVKAHLARYDRLTGGASNTAYEQGRKRSGIIVIRGLEINKDERTVTLNDNVFNLTPKEYDILLFLMENPNRVYSKDDLFERIWGLEAFGDGDTVVVHVRRLREKIEPDPKNPKYIETVWGAGYKFRV